MKPIQDLRECGDASLVGGKAANLGALLRAGFTVPDGFVMTAAANDNDRRAIRDAYRALNAQTVAVRSSATTEDGLDKSMAGQFTTVLNVHTETELFEAIDVCKASAQAPGTRAYLREGNSPNDFSMAVVIQRQVPSEVAGVLFTQAPHAPNEMLIEASRDLGENVVAGLLQPEVYRVNSQTGEIIDAHGAGQGSALREENVARLFALGRQVATHFGSPQDIEWAISNDELFLLQARPITTAKRAADRNATIEEARRKLAESSGGPWLIHNLAETLPQPTPLTWSIIRGFMSGGGGFGAMYRRLGFDPGKMEFLELILGKVYMDLSRAPELFGHRFPFAYDVEGVQRDPELGEQPPTVPNGSWFARLQASRKMSRARRRLDIESRDYDQRLTNKVIPSFVAWCTEEKTRDLSLLSVEEWLALWQNRERRVFDEFAPQIFYTNFIASLALERLRDSLAEHCRDESADELAQRLAFSGAPDMTIIADAELREVARGERSIETWLTSYGHRAVSEFDLAAPRWREIPDTLSAYAARLRNGADPLEANREQAKAARHKIGQLPPGAARELGKKVELAQRYLVFRENGKHYLMLGYDLLRDMVLDASRRLNADVVWLTFDEMAVALRQGSVPQSQLDRRKRQYRAETRLTLPHLIDREGIAKIGEPINLDYHDQFKGAPISGGFAQGSVRIVQSPLRVADLAPGYVLVCPSTDPAWTPLFMNASAVVLECGGSLSHGAIIAREMNLPAVVLPNATRLLREGEHVFVDGTSGVISRTIEAPAASIAVEKRPPSATRERFGTRLRDVGFVLWGVFLLAAWILPRNLLLQSSFESLDWLLWPIVRSLGRPAAVLLIGAGLALMAALTQFFLADNARLREARRRTKLLRGEAAGISLGAKGSHTAMSKFAFVQRRLIAASLVPVGIWLGVFVMTFVWLADRMNRINPIPGSTARVTATIDANFREPVSLSVDSPVSLDQNNPPTRLLAPIREALERLKSRGQMSSAKLNDLETYLRRGVPSQTLTWLVRSSTAGSFPATVTFGERRSFKQFVIFGESFPPPFQGRISDRHLPLRSITVEATATAPPFWSTGKLIPGFDHNVTWPWIYLAGYLSVWWLVRWLLGLV